MPAIAASLPIKHEPTRLRTKIAAATGVSVFTITLIAEGFDPSENQDTPMTDTSHSESVTAPPMLPTS
ncbi:hypothetical protein [Rhodococcus sp. UFZ-B548]|uniref:hypothetical protein n=1 Tax=Rhodococcus sp. UFZ-B548 TaxID=2742212 RepID=UPI0015F40DCA|nr:hypothetical protein [Rhodococcus sp. UFZ-B548]